MPEVLGLLLSSITLNIKGVERMEEGLRGRREGGGREEEEGGRRGREGGGRREGGREEGEYGTSSTTPLPVNFAAEYWMKPTSTLHHS